MDNNNKKKSQGFKLYKKFSNQQQANKCEQEFQKLIQQHSSNYINHYFRNKKKISVYFKFKQQNQLYEWLLDQGFKEPQLTTEQKKRIVYVTNNNHNHITNNNHNHIAQQLNQPRSNWMSVSQSSCSSSSNEKKDVVHKKQKTEIQPQKVVLTESEQKEYLQLEFFLSDLVTQLEKDQLKYSNLCKMINKIQFKTNNNDNNNNSQIPTMTDYPALLFKFKNQVREFLQQELEYRDLFNKKKVRNSFKLQQQKSSNKNYDNLNHSNSTEKSKSVLPSSQSQMFCSKKESIQSESSVSLLLLQKQLYSDDHNDNNLEEEEQKTNNDNSTLPFQQAIENKPQYQQQQSLSSLNESTLPSSSSSFHNNKNLDQQEDTISSLKLQISNLQKRIDSMTKSKPETFKKSPPKFKQQRQFLKSEINQIRSIIHQQEQLQSQQQLQRQQQQQKPSQPQKSNKKEQQKKQKQLNDLVQQELPLSTRSRVKTIQNLLLKSNLKK